jgi:hypothetical protein
MANITSRGSFVFGFQDIDKTKFKVVGAKSRTRESLPAVTGAETTTQLIKDTDPGTIQASLRI